MKCFCFLFSAFLCYNAVLSQPSTDSIPNWIRHPEIPSFTLLTIDSLWFGKQNLPIKTPIVIIYFSPDCGHCKAKAKLLADRKDSLDNIYFVWASYHPIPELKFFAETYGLAKCKNVKIGRDTRFFFPVYYKARVTPYIAIYNRRGLFAKEFREGEGLQDILNAIKIEK